MNITLCKIMSLLWESDISERDFCNEIGINKSAVTDWKAGKTQSYNKHLARIADFFDVPIEYFSDTPATSPLRVVSIERETENGKMQEMRDPLFRAIKNEMKLYFLSGYDHVTLCEKTNVRLELIIAWLCDDFSISPNRDRVKSLVEFLLEYNYAKGERSPNAEIFEEYLDISTESDKLEKKDGA